MLIPNLIFMNAHCETNENKAPINMISPFLKIYLHY